MSDRRLFAALLLTACGSAPTQMEPPTPVATTPLAGTVGGVPWVAKSAVASSRRAFSDDGGERWIDIGSGTFDCSDFIPEAEIIGTLVWAPDAYSLSLSRNLTFVVREDGDIVNKVATNGRVELITATQPDAGPSVLRLRARFDADNSIDGEISVTVCD